MAQPGIESDAVQSNHLPDLKEENLRRYGYLILDLLWEKYHRKTANGAIVGRIKTNAEEVASQLDISKQVAGRTLTALVTVSSCVQRASQSYVFDVSRMGDLRQEMRQINDLHTRKAESAAIQSIVYLYGPLTAREIQSEVANWLGYELSIGQVNERFSSVENLTVLPGNGGHVLVSDNILSSPT